MIFEDIIKLQQENEKLKSENKYLKEYITTLEDQFQIAKELITYLKKKPIKTKK